MLKQTDNPPYRWKTIRVFISSTFRDMHAERDYLVKYVFPELREWCQQYKLHLVDIDLRWGVTSSEAESGKVLDICLDQIDGSRPFFICMLGNRYGWVPNRKEVSETTRRVYDRIQGKKDYSITHLEIHHAVLEPLRSLDALEEAPHAFFYFRDKDSLPSPDKLNNYSKIEQEEYCKTYIEKDSNNANRLDELKQEIQNHYQSIGKAKGNVRELEERVFIYRPYFDSSMSNPEDEKLKGRFTPGSFKEFGARVQADIRKAITLQFAERIKVLSNKKEQKDLETERDLHESFIENRTRLFIGRTDLLKRLHEYVNSDSRKILAVYGEPGSGKSALLAKFFRDFKYDTSGKEINRNILFIPHFAGASPASCLLPNILRRFCEELKAAYDIKDFIPLESNKLSETFKSFINKVTGKAIILIDGLNQLDEVEHAHELNWLPFELPANMKIIASTLEGATKEALVKKTDESLVVTPLTNEECREFINKMPSVFCKTLDEKHIRLFLTKDETRNPLYLKVAIDELRVFGSFEKLEKKIAALPPDVESLFISVLERLEKDRPDESEIVERLFCLLECSRFGLESHELRELMEPFDKLNSYQAILRQMRDYLIPRGELIDFFHRALSKAIRQKYLNNGEAVQWHRKLAEYFKARSLYIQPNQTQKDAKPQPNLRKLLEQPWQETYGQRWTELEETLTDLNYIEAKCMSELRYELVNDYNLAQKSWPDNEEEKQENERLRRIKKYTDELIVYSKDPNNKPLPEEPLIIFSHQEIKDQQKTDNWTPIDRIKVWKHFVASNITRIRSKDPIPDNPDDFKLNIDPEALYEEPIYQLAFNFVDSGPIQDKLKDDKFKQSIPWIKLWNRPSCTRKPACILSLVGPQSPVTSIAVTPDGSRAISASDFGLRVWNLNTGECEWYLKGRNGVAMTADGLRAVSGAYSFGPSSNELKVWNLQTGQCTLEFQGHTNEVTTTSITPDGRLAVSGSCPGLSGIQSGKDKHFRVWDLEKNECFYTSGEHTSDIQKVLISPNGQYVVSQSDSTYVWDLKERRLLYKIADGRKNFGITIDSQRLIIVNDSVIKTIKLKNGDLITSNENFHQSVSDIAISPSKIIPIIAIFISIHSNYITAMKY